MEEKTKDQSSGRSGRFFQRAAAWEISDSDADSDTDSGQTRTVTLMNPAAGTLDPGVCDQAAPEELEACLSTSEPASPRQVATPSLRRSVMKRIPEDLKVCQTRAESRKLKKEIRKTEKERRKVQEALEKQRQREAIDALKLLRPDQCLKYLTICIDPGLLKDPGSDALMEAFDSLGCKYYIEPQEMPCSITWRRNTPNSFSTTGDTLVKSEEENEVLLLVDPRDFLKHLFSITQSLRDAPSGNRPDLSQLLPLNCLEGPSLKSFSLAVIGLCTYTWYDSHQDKQWALTPAEHSRHKDPRFPSSPKLSVTQQDLEEVNELQALNSNDARGHGSCSSVRALGTFLLGEGLVVLQLWGTTEVLFLDTWHELSQHVSALTKAIAKRPYKKQLKTQLFSFCTDGGWPSIRVEKDGMGLKELWKRQIQQFNRVSPAVAAAITAVYPSPSLLLQAYEECSTEKDRLLLLRDIPVKAEDNRRKRQIGTDLSRRVYLFMTSTNADLVLDIEKS